MANFKKMAMEQLNYDLSALRDPAKVEEINNLVETLKAEAKASSGSGNRLSQQMVAQALTTFEGFSDNPQVYGPTVRELQGYFESQEIETKENQIAQHLHKMKNAGVIASARKVETNGKRGAPPVFHFLMDEVEFNRILNGEIVVKG